MVESTMSDSSPPIRVLIVEDNFAVAQSLEHLLRAYDYEVVGMAPSISAAMRIASERPFDVAILDIDLNGTSVAPVAEHVEQLGARLIFLTGYGDCELLPPHLRDRPRLDKPVDVNLLIPALRDLAGHNPPS